MTSQFVKKLGFEEFQIFLRRKLNFINKYLSEG